MRAGIRRYGGIPIRCADGTKFRFTRNMDFQYRAEYRDIDVTMQIAKLATWLKRNPAKRPERGAVHGLINAWLKKANNRRPWQR